MSSASRVGSQYGPCLLPFPDPFESLPSPFPDPFKSLFLPLTNFNNLAALRHILLPGSHFAPGYQATLSFSLMGLLEDDVLLVVELLPLLLELELLLLELEDMPSEPHRQSHYLLLSFSQIS